MSAAAPRAAMHIAQKSGFSASILSQAKAAMRQFESHPFERYPKTLKSAPADWSRVGTRFNRAVIWYVPWMAGFLGWPLLCEKALRHT